MTSWMYDIRYALRRLRKSPGFTLTVVITLALGIGANTAIFTLVQGILLSTLPVSDPKSLYRIGDTDNCCVNGGFPGENGDFDIYSYDLYLHLKKSAPEFEQLAAVTAGRWGWAVRRGNEFAKPMQGEFVSGNFFSTLGLGAYLGRPLGESDDTPASAGLYAELPRVADGVQCGPVACRVHHFHQCAALHSGGHCTGRVLWRSSNRCARGFLDAAGDGAIPARAQLHPSP